MDRKQYEEMKKRFGHWGSWAVWNPDKLDDLDCIEQRIGRLHTGFVFVGLNASRDLLNQPSWRNFHYLHPGSKERKLCRVLSGTRYEGSYMTDILKDRFTPHAVEAAGFSGGFSGKDSGKDEKILREELAVLDKIKRIETVFCFGRDAFKFWRQCPGLKDFPVRQVTHFAAFGRLFEDRIYGELGLEKH